MPGRGSLPAQELASTKAGGVSLVKYLYEGKNVHMFAGFMSLL